MRLKPIAAATESIRRWFTGLGIKHRMLIGYVVVVLIPVLTGGAVLFDQIYRGGVNSYAQTNHALVEQMNGNFKSSLHRVEAIYELLQFNTSVIELISGYYTAEHDQVYVYNKDVKPLLSYIRLSNRSIGELTLYRHHPSVLTLGDAIVGIERLEPDVLEHAHRFPAGTWLPAWADDGVRLTYFRSLYSVDYSRIVGVLAIAVDGDLLFGQFHDKAVLLVQGQHAALLPGGSGIIPDGFDWQPLLRGGESPYFFADVGARRVLVHRLRIAELGADAFVVAPVDSVFAIGWKTRLTIIGVVLLLLVLLSCIYYFIVTSVTRRVIRLARHMRNIGEDNLSLFPHDRHQTYRDEIQYLIRSFNAMMNRINTLVHTVHKAELRQKEATYLALQAQINPHFLYNSLETMRMMALSNGDREVADMSYTLGKLMRYGLSRQTEVALSEEIAHLEHYLLIQQTRLGSRLQYRLELDAPAHLYVCPKFIIQPLVENAVVHGIARRKRGGTIHIRVAEERQQARITIRDDGTGIRPDALRALQRRLERTFGEAPSPGQPAPGQALEAERPANENNGIGITNVHERLQAYYGAHCGVRVDSTYGEGTTVTVTLDRRRTDESIGCRR